ncbi:centrosomal protein [Anaeramoeba flamelloides]|uniref:Centrosomal protein n=1 Tax=Anaeramoeba flamelloides TaxID=1746091 RepID=A0AAV7YXA5_9EUKA|nr:centrosomal protein [Anaeramoeba flamelloides]
MNTNKIHEQAISRYQREVENLNQTINELQGSLRQSIKEKLQLESEQNNKNKSRFSSPKNLNEPLIFENDKLKKTIKRLEKEIKKATGNRSNMFELEDNSKLYQQIRENNEEIQTLVESNEYLKKQNKKLSDQNKELFEKLLNRNNEGTKSGSESDDESRYTQKAYENSKQLYEEKIKRLEEDLKKKERQINKLRSNTSFEQDSEELNEELQSLEKELEEVRTERNKAQDELDNLRDELQNEKRNGEKLNRKLSSLQRKLQDEQRKNKNRSKSKGEKIQVEELEQENSERTKKDNTISEEKLLNDNLKLMSEIKKRDQRIDRYKSKNGSLQQQLNDLKQKLATRSDQDDDESGNGTKSDSEDEELKRKYQDANDEIKKLKEQILQQDKELIDYKYKLKDQKSDDDDDNDDKDNFNEIRKYRNRNLELQKELINAEKKIHRLELALKNNNNGNLELGLLNEKIKELNRNLKLKVVEIERLKTLLQKEPQIRSVLKPTPQKNLKDDEINESLSTLIEEKKRILNDFQQQNSNLSNQLLLSSQFIEKLRSLRKPKSNFHKIETLETLRNEITDLEIEIQTLEQQITLLNLKIKELNFETNKYRNENNNLTIENDTLNKDLLNKNKEMKSLETQIKRNQRQINLLSNLNENLEKKNEDLNLQIPKQNRNLKKELNKWKLNNDNLNNLNEELENENDDLKNENEDLKNENDGLKNKINDLEEEKIDKENQLKRNQKKISYLNNLSNNLKKVNDDLKKQNEEQELELLKPTKPNDNNNLKNQQLEEDELLKPSSFYSSRKSNRRRSGNNDLKNKLNQLNNLNEELENENDDLKNTINDLKNKIRKYGQQLKQRQDLINQLYQEKEDKGKLKNKRRSFEPKINLDDNNLNRGENSSRRSSILPNNINIQKDKISLLNQINELQIHNFVLECKMDYLNKVLEEYRLVEQNVLKNLLWTRYTDGPKVARGLLSQSNTNSYESNNVNYRHASTRRFVSLTSSLINTIRKVNNQPSITITKQDGLPFNKTVYIKDESEEIARKLFEKKNQVLTNLLLKAKNDQQRLSEKNRKTKLAFEMTMRKLNDEIENMEKEVQDTEGFNDIDLNNDFF